MGNNIQVPYTGFVNGGIREGMDVIIHGRMGHQSKVFSVNLCSANNKTDGDVPFHFNPRHHQDQVVRNHKQSGAWGREETDGEFPFKADKDFALRVKVKDSKYKVEVDGEEFCEFKHRMPKEAVQYLIIDGDVQISTIQFKYPLPYSAPFPGLLREGSAVTITGKAKDDFDAFSVNLCSAPVRSEGDVALHFNPRHGQGHVVRNHHQDSWGQEETAGGSPFHRGELFQIHIQAEYLYYRVSVNGSHFCDFAHRMPKETVRHVCVEGDVELYSVQV